MPIAYEFAPELVIVSSKFQADLNNPSSINNVTSEAYGYFIKWLSGLANGRLIICFEDPLLDSYLDSVIECIGSLLGDPLPTMAISNDDLNYRCVESIRNVLLIQEKFWSSLKFNKKIPKNVGSSH